MKRRDHNRLHGSIRHTHCEIERLVIIQGRGEISSCMESLCEMEHIEGLSSTEIFELIDSRGLILDKEHKGH